jgi:hypothetical protein
MGLPHLEGKYLQRVWICEAIGQLPTSSVLLGLGGIDLSALSVRSNSLPFETVTAAECQGYLKAALSMPDIEDIRQYSGSDSVLRLDLAITEMNPGHSLIREAVHSELPYGFGIGLAWMQVEGLISDDRSGKPLVAFLERRKHDGEVGLSLRRWLARVRASRLGVARTMTREMAESIALDILREIKVALIERWQLPKDAEARPT